MAVKLLETGLLSQMDSESDSSLSSLGSSLVDSLPLVSCTEEGSLFEEHIRWNFRGMLLWEQ